MPKYFPVSPISICSAIRFMLASGFSAFEERALLSV